MSDQDQTLFIPAQRPPFLDGGPVVGGADDETAVTPKRELIAPPPSRISAWDEKPAVRGVAPVEGAPFGRVRALGTLAWVLSVVTMTALALIRLNWASMRVPELGFWGFTLTPKRHVFDMLHDVNAADTPYLLALKGWTAVFGRSDFALRVPSMLAMAGAVALISVLANRIGGPKVGLLAGMTAAVLPVTSRFAQEVGPQALTLFGSTLATLVLVALLDRPKAWQFVWYAAAVALTGLAHVTGLLVIVGHLFVLLAMKRRLLPAWSVATLIGLLPAVALCFTPGIKPWYIPRGKTAAGMPSVIQLSEETFGAVIVAGIVIGFGLLAMSARKPAIVYSTWAVIPLALLYPVVHATTIPAEQLAIVAAPGWIGLAAMGLARAVSARGLTAVTALAALAIPAQIAIRSGDGHGQATHELADVLFTEGKPGDAIVYGPATDDGPAGRDIVNRYLSASHRPADILARSRPRDDGHLAVTECPDVDACLGKTQRVWLVRVGVRDSPLTGLEAGKDGALRVRYSQTQSWPLTGLSLTLFTLKPNA